MGACGGNDHNLFEFAISVAAILFITTMTSNSTSDSISIFQDGKLKPGIYKIQNLHTQTFMDIQEDTRDVCCRPATLLGEGRGLVRPVQ